MKPGSLEWFRWFYDGRLDRPGDIEARWHEDLVVVQAPEMVGTAGEFHGYDGLKAVNEELAESYKHMVWNPQEVIELGDDRYLVLVKAHGVGRASGIDLDPQNLGHIVTVRGDRAARMEVHIGWDKAREAAGLG